MASVAVELVLAVTERHERGQKARGGARIADEHRGALHGRDGPVPAGHLEPGARLVAK